jgi:hypothetical protein
MTVQTAGTCTRCSSPLDEGAFCADETCPFSDHDQSCHVGWVGHCDTPDEAEADGHVYADEGTKCTCAWGWARP